MNSSLELSDQDAGVRMSNVVFDQAWYAAAVALSNNPIMHFSGNILDFVKFMMMLETNFEHAIHDSPTLYSIWQKHLIGNAASVIDSCNYLGGVNWYKIALEKLCAMYGNKSTILKAHRKRLNSSVKVGDNISDFT